MKRCLNVIEAKDIRIVVYRAFSAARCVRVLGARQVQEKKLDSARQVLLKKNAIL